MGMGITSWSHLFSGEFRSTHPPPQGNKRGSQYKRSVRSLNIHSSSAALVLHPSGKKEHLDFFSDRVLFETFIFIAVQINALKSRSRFTLWIGQTKMASPLFSLEISSFICSEATQCQGTFADITWVRHGRASRRAALRGSNTVSAARNKCYYVCLWKKLRALPLTLSSLLHCLVSLRS